MIDDQTLGYPHSSGIEGTKHSPRRPLFLNADGTVKSHRKISDTAGGFVGGLDDGDIFGIGVAVLDKTDFHGAAKVAVAASNDDDGGSDRGATGQD